MKRIVGLLGWLGVVLVLAAVVLRFTQPEQQRWYQGLALAGLIVTALYALSQWRDIARSFQGRNVRYGSIAASGIVLFLAVLVGINWLSNRYNKRWDLTAARQFSLSDQTRQILTSLQKPVAIKVFYKNEPGGLDRYRDQLAEYEYTSKQVSVEYIDADKEPVRAKQYEVQSYGTVVFEYDGRVERTTSTDEQGLTNALKKVIEGQAKKIYFVQGHGEHDPTSSEANGYSGYESSLRSDNFEVAKLTLAQEGKVPDDATIVIVAGPKTDVFAPELDALRAYLKRAGKLLLMLDPPEKADAPQPTSLIALAKEWGFDVGTNVVVDATGLGRQIMGTDASVPIGNALPHPITEGFQLITGFPFARSVTPLESGADGKFPQKVIETFPQSWAETDLKALYTTGKPNRENKGNLLGPVTLIAAVSAPATDAAAPSTADGPKPESRVVVAGDSDFISNRFINIPGNRDLGLNIANWLAQQENLIAIRPRDPESRPIILSEDQSRRIFWLSMFIVPGLLFATAVRVWWKRR